jgi:copper transport protein
MDTDSVKNLTTPKENESITDKEEYFNTPSPATTTAISKFNKTTKIEALIGIALLLAVAVMVNSGLPDSEFQSAIQQQKQQYQNGQALLAQTANKPFTSTSFTQDGDIISLSIDPFAPGSNNFQIKFLNSTWIPIDISSAKMRLTQTEKGIGPIEVDTRRVASAINEFSTSASFGIPGKWEIQIEGTPKKGNAPNIVGTFDLLVKPPLDQTKFNVHEFHIPSNMNGNSSATQPLYPVYDKSRNVIWVGDTSIGSGRLLAFNLSSGKYYSHSLSGTSIVTSIALDSNHNNDIWYIDPLNKNLGNFDPNTNTNTLYRIKSQGPPSGVTISNSVNNSTVSNIWISLPVDNELLRFNLQTKNFTNYRIPTPNSGALGIAADNSGLIWFAEASSGKLGSIDTNRNFKITEYPSSGKDISNSSLKSPTAILIDPDTDNIYISEHDGHAITVFDPVLKTFKRYPELNPKGLPFGMALDGYHNLWIAEHVINKISVIDTTTGEHKDINIPANNPFTQWLTADTNGNIWFAEQRGNSLGTVSAIAGPLQASSSPSQATSPNSTNSVSYSKNNAIPQLSFSYADIIGPGVAAGIIFCAIFYARSIVDLKKSMSQLTRINNTEIDKKKA